MMWKQRLVRAYFPDIERCEWVNKILKQIWPSATHIAETVIKNRIEPNVAQALANIKMQGFRFDKVMLGTVPPRIGGVKIYDENLDRNEIIMDLDLYYASDCKIDFYLSGVKGGINDFQIHGTLRVVMKPLISSMPLIGGLQIFFFNNPNVDFRFVGLLGTPELSDLLRRIFVEQIASIMLLPNKLCIRLSDEVAAVTLNMPEPEGVLRIHLVEAMDLMNRDITVPGRSKLNPYALINIGAQEFKTKMINNTVNPKWNYWCEVAVYSHLGQEVVFNLWNFDQEIKDVQANFLGRASLEISSVVEKGSVDTCLILEETSHGLLYVRLCWYELTSNSHDLEAALLEIKNLRVPTMSAAVLSVFVDSAKNISHAQSMHNPDTYLVLRVGDQSETLVQLNNNSPVWEQGFTFMVGNPNNEILHLKIINQKTGNEIDCLAFSLSILLSKKNMKSQSLQLKSGPDSKILMSLALKIIKRADSTAQLSPASSLTDISQIEQLDISFSNPEVVKPISSFTSISKGYQQESTALARRINSATGFGLGRIQLSICYSSKHQELTVTIHQVMQIPSIGPLELPDPYVKLYLKTKHSNDSKTPRTTQTIKNTCNPIYEATFKYSILLDELIQSDLEIIVCSEKVSSNSNSPVIGMVVILLSEPDISSEESSLKEVWFYLEPENKKNSLLFL